MRPKESRTWGTKNYIQGVRTNRRIMVLVLVLAVAVGVATITFARQHADIMTSRETFSDQLNPAATGDSVRTE